LNRQIPWLRISLEGVLIVTSILLAFGIDAWWADQQEQKEAVRLVESLHEDFTATRSSLAETIRIQEETVDRLTRLDRMSALDLARLPSDSVDGFTFAVVAPWTFDAQSGTLEALVASGRLGVLGVEGLPSALLEWKARVEDLEEEKAEVRAVANISRRRTASLGGPWPTQDLGITPFMVQALRDFATADLTVVATDVELRALLREKRMACLVYLAELVPLLAQTDSIVSILDDALS
jgi:hypothetical protein